MHIIIGVLAAVVILSLMGTATLSDQWGEIDLFVQAIGIGEGNITPPIVDATIELRLDTIPPQNEVDDPITIVTACVFKSPENIPLGTGKSDGVIICKLLNEAGNAIAEGLVPLSVSAEDPDFAYKANEPIIIDINQPAFEGATEFDRVWNAKVIITAPI